MKTIYWLAAANNENLVLIWVQELNALKSILQNIREKNPTGLADIHTYKF